MRKKILAMLCVCICILGLAACGADPKAMDYNGMTYQELEQNAMAVWERLQSMEISRVESAIAEIDALAEAERIAFFQQTEGAKEDLALMRSWVSIYEEIGAYVGVESFTVTETGKNTTTDLVLNYENRPIIVSVVYKNRDMSVENVTVDIVYSMGEKMQNAALNTVMGMGTVFLMLIIISLIISCFGLISKLENKFKKKDAADATAAPQAEEPVQQYVQETDDLEFVAVIAAAIAAHTGQSAEDFVVRSIKRR